MVIDTVYHSIDPDLRFETFFEKREKEKGDVDFEIGD